MAQPDIHTQNNEAKSPTPHTPHTCAHAKTNTHTQTQDGS